MREVIKTEEDTFAYKLWHSRFLCCVTAAFTDNSAWSSEYGSPTTGDKDRDMQQAMDTVRTYRTIPELAKLMAAGSHISIMNTKDSLRIYNLVRGYLKEYGQTLSENAMVFKIDDAERARLERVMEGIGLLVEFVNAVQDLAKITLNNQPMQRAAFGLDISKVFGAKTKTTHTIDKLPESPVDIFTEQLNSPELVEIARTLEWQ